jgi:hypothetical protein
LPGIVSWVPSAKQRTKKKVRLTLLDPLRHRVECSSPSFTECCKAALTARKVGGYNPGGKEDSAMTIEDLDRLPTIHYTQIAEPPADDPNYQELQTFRRELPRLLAQGHEHKWALIRGNEVIGVYETFDEGCSAGRKRYLLEAYLVQPVREWQPLFHTKVHL